MIVVGTIELGNVGLVGSTVSSPLGPPGSETGDEALGPGAGKP